MLLDTRIPFIYVFNKVKRDVLYVILAGVVVHYLTTALGDYFPDMPLAIPLFLGTAISILLSFKLSQAYERWWEARKIWGSIVNDSRTWVIQLQSFLPGDEHKEVIKRMSFRQIAWCYALASGLRGLAMPRNLSEYLSEEELQTLNAHSNKALAVVQMNALELSRLKKLYHIETLLQLQLDDTMVRLVDSMGRAERINTTVFPRTYRLFLHFAIYLFVIILSISLQDVSVFFEIPLLVFISVTFFLLEKSSSHLQDPFRNRPSDISISAISRTIEINIKQLLGEENIPQPLTSDTYYIL